MLGTASEDTVNQERIHQSNNQSNRLLRGLKNNVMKLERTLLERCKTLTRKKRRFTPFLEIADTYVDPYFQKRNKYAL
jgi:hypothetical protein